MRGASVIIPARDRADILPHTLAALAGQSCPASRFEVIVVDDGSRDETARIVRDRRYPFRLVYVRLVRQEGFCPARPRNDGLFAATRELAIFLDADVLALPELVAEHLAAHAGGGRPRAVIGYTYGYAFQPADRTPEVLNPPPPERVLAELPRLVASDSARWGDGREPIYAETRDLAEHPAPWQMYWTNNVSVPRMLALEIGGFDEAFVGWGVEDLEFAYRLHERGVPIRLARRAGAVHYPHALPDMDARWVQLQRNRRRLIGKHPGPALELRLWNARQYADTWPAVAAMLAAPAPPEAGSDVVALVDRLCAETLPPGPLLLCGAFPAEAVRRWSPAGWCRPVAGGTSPGTAQRAPAGLPLLGVFTPWEDQTFAAAVLGEQWRRLPPVVAEAIVQEMRRVAEAVAVLLPAGSLADAPGVRRGSGDGWEAVRPAMLSGEEWQSVRVGGVSALVTRTGGGKGNGLRRVERDSASPLSVPMLAGGT